MFNICFNQNIYGNILMFFFRSIYHEPSNSIFFNPAKNASILSSFLSLDRYASVCHYNTSFDSSINNIRKCGDTLTLLIPTYTHEYVKFIKF